MATIPELSEDERQKIRDALKKRGAGLPCPRCGNKSFSLLDGYLMHTIQTSLEDVPAGEQVVPTVAVVCDRCGYLSHHALGILGLLD
ncbi:MAG: hypothetical protein DRO11_05335 [Methanobacteriota archaeon]|nr:MAG: hypothetical protein DRO11_05335 [Euryarchaeota archaeon]